MKQNNKKFNNAMHKFVGVLDKYGLTTRASIVGIYRFNACKRRRFYCAV